jgi:hypothetical protein
LTELSKIADIPGCHELTTVAGQLGFHQLPHRLLGYKTALGGPISITADVNLRGSAVRVTFPSGAETDLKLRQ